MAAKLTAQEARLAKRVGKDGPAFVHARRQRPGMSLREFAALDDAARAELAPSAAQEPPAETKTTAAKKTAAKKATGTTGRH